MSRVILMRADAGVPVSAGGDTAPIVGHWRNCTDATEHIAAFDLWVDDAGGLRLRVFGAGPDAMIDWGETSCTAYVAPASMEISGLHARYALDGADVQLAINHAKGILVIQTYTTFTDGSGRAAYYSREFFHR